MQWVLAATLICVASFFTACGNVDNSVDPTHGGEGKIVGNWFSDVSGLTYAKWNYDKTWQNTEFKADGTGDAEKAAGLMFERSTPSWQNGYVEEVNDIYYNGDFKMIRMDKFDAIS